MFYRFYLHLFIIYNSRLLAKDWRSFEEERIVRTKEILYAEEAAKYMPADILLELPLGIRKIL